MKSPIRARLATAAATAALLFGGTGAPGAPAAGAAALVCGGVGSSVVPVAAADPLQIKAATDQALQVLNPFNSILVVDFEVFTLTYDLLVNLGPDLEPSPGFAESWTASNDGLT